MENTDIIEKCNKREKFMEIEFNACLEEEPGIKNSKYKKDLKTKYGEIN